ncbi:class I SAM-dependent methyltransferase [Bdellovibrio reynosensis]|uniref:Methyltransferase type 11 domain-containing protein n=1 Tax=Bdellovibrio reynosensis TaxID=2835041 RepID=A0ABY4C7M8_9BACT|nr:hypothetical protein [Bdellovibrio reynosensis]UOF00997.1 hypothetical protein MNR06_14950 [Bdellovibrio reynosensis]
MKLNLGCGFQKKEGFVNVDISAGCNADVVLDCATEKWPWADSSVDEVHFDFSLEQMGESKKDLQCILQELYRVCKNDAVIKIVFIHPRHDQFELNPLCSHRLSPEFFNLLSVSNNLSMIANGSFDTSLGLAWGVNFNMARHKYLVTSQLGQEMEAGRISEDQIRQRIPFDNNICHAVEVDLTVIKNVIEIPVT